MILEVVSLVESQSKSCKNGGFRLDINELIEVKKTKTDINIMSPLVWAYVGDSVYELYIRTHLVNTTKLKPNKLHIESIKYVKAKAQAEILFKIQDKLTEEENEIVRRTRNTENHHLPKNAELKDYMYATAFEGLIGYLYLTNQEKRLKEILELAINKEK
jgi:ribonuclease-3 family protein